MGRTEEYTAKEMCEAVRETGGNVQLAAQKLGCHPQTVYNYRDRYKTVAQALREAQKDTYTEAVTRLMRIMRSPEHPRHYKALKDIVTTFGEHVNDGLDWSDRKRNEVKTDQDEDVTFNVRYEDMSDE